MAPAIVIVVILAFVGVKEAVNHFPHPHHHKKPVVTAVQKP